MSHYYAHVVQMTKMLKQLSHWLDKAEAHAAAKKYDVAVLLQSRLAPDMFTLRRQIQSACDMPKFLAARLAGQTPPKHEDGEQTIAELRARIQSVVEYTAGFKESDFADAATRVIPLGFMKGKGLKADDFVYGFNVPNAYFHFSMAYAILRHNGVDVGKMDFLGDLSLVDI